MPINFCLQTSLGGSRSGENVFFAEGHKDLYQYNEILVDHNWWNRHLPATIEAFFADGDAGSKIAAADRAELMRQYGLSEAEAPPLVWIDRMNWANPFH